MPIGNLIAFLQYVMQILFAVMMAVFMFIMVPRAVVSSGRIQEVLRTEPSIGDPEAPATPPPGRGTLAFRDVEFRYPGAQDPVLRDISLVVEPGKTTAIVGSTGSGKTTLINLIPRFYDVTGGPARRSTASTSATLDRDDLWSRIGLVPQKAFLFSGTIASNLRFGKADATDDELWAALRIAQAETFVRELDGRPRGAGHPGRVEPVRRPAPAAGDRPGAGQAARDLRLRRQLLRARLQDRFAAPGRARATRSPTRPSSSSPSASARSWAPTGSSSSTAARSSGSARTTS